MIAYGETKRGSSKLHPHNKCSVCSEKSFGKKTARQISKKEIFAGIQDMIDNQQGSPSWATETVDKHFFELF